MWNGKDGTAGGDMQREKVGRHWWRVTESCLHFVDHVPAETSVHTPVVSSTTIFFCLSLSPPVFPLVLQFPHSPSHIYSPSHTFRVLFPAVHFRGIFHRHQSTRRTWDSCFTLLLVLHLSRVCFACAPQRKMEQERSHLQTWRLTNHGCNWRSLVRKADMSVNSPWSTTHSLNLDSRSS